MSDNSKEPVKEKQQRAEQTATTGTKGGHGRKVSLQGILDQILLDIRDKIQNQNGTTGQPLTDEEKDTLRETGKILVQNFTGFVEAYREAKSLFTGVDNWFARATPATMSTMGFLFGNMKDLLPELKEELEIYKQETGQAEIDFAEFMRNIDPETGATTESILSRLIKRAQAKTGTPAADAAALLAEELPKLEALSKRPESYIIPNNPIANSLTGRADKKTGEVIEVVDAGGFDLPVMKTGKPGEVTAYTMIATDETAGVTMTGKKFTEYDRCIYNGIVSLYEAGNAIVTPEMICRTMANRTDTEKVTPQQVGAVTKSLEKMRHIFVKANVTEEMKKRHLYAEGAPITGGYIDSYLLQLTGVHVTAGGKVRDAYRIDTEPVLLTYSKITKQLLTVPMQLLDIKVVKSGKIQKAVVNTTEKRQPIKEYLLRRIEVMKHARRNKHSTQDTHILFDTLYRETEINGADKQAALDARKYVFMVLDYWQTTGYIAGYEQETAGRKIKGVNIILS